MTRTIEAAVPPARRRHIYTLRHVHAQCQECDWESEAKNARANAARHHDRTGHYVHVIEEVSIEYGEPPVPQTEVLFGP